MQPFLPYGNYTIENDRFKSENINKFIGKYLINMGSDIDVYDFDDPEGLGIVINYEEMGIYFAYSGVSQRMDIFHGLTANLNKFMSEVLIDKSEEEYVVLIKECIRVLDSVTESANNLSVGNNNTKRALFFN